jgi:hypothetical protein
VFILAANAGITTAAPRPPLCPAGWSEFEARCYWFSGKESRLSWLKAETDCIHRGGHLASVHSRAEQNFVFSISSNYTWLGASDTVSEVGFYSYTFSSLYIYSAKLVFLKGSRQWESRGVRNVSNGPNLSRTEAIEVRFSLNFAVVFDFTNFRFRPRKAKWIGIVSPKWRYATIRSMFFSLLYTAHCLLTHRVSRRS